MINRLVDYFACYDVYNSLYYLNSRRGRLTGYYYRVNWLELRDIDQTEERIKLNMTNLLEFYKMKK